ncbi:MAG: hypothetical protein K5745_02700 [Saccharofermentans sp.]|nr:hypothetical protein [Saccharofermentans sp.]
MSPFDMMVFFCIILAAIKCGIEFYDYWKNIDEEATRQPRYGQKRQVNKGVCMRAAGARRAKTTVHPNSTKHAA